MTQSDNTYHDYLDRVDIQELLVDAGYHLYRRDGLRYPSYVALDSDGRRISGDKFIVTANGKCCFHPPEQKCWNVISFIKDHPHLFREYEPGMKPDHLVNLVCRRILNEPLEIRNDNILSPQKEHKAFSKDDYDLTVYNKYDKGTVRLFQKFFGPRGIDLKTQQAFQHDFLLAQYDTSNGRNIMNLAFPLCFSDETQTRGFEMRGFQTKDGKSFKGLAKGSDATRAVWVGNPGRVPRSDARHVYWFESTYDAMAYYQLKSGEAPELHHSLFISTSGNPGVGQMADMMKTCPMAVHHICFDNDLAGRQFHANFLDTADKELGLDKNAKLLDIRRELPSEGYKDWNDELLRKPSKSIEKVIVYKDAIGRQIAVSKVIPPNMLRYLESLHDRKDVFSGNRDLLPESYEPQNFKAKVLQLLGVAALHPQKEVSSPNVDENREKEVHYHR